jgi:integrase
MEVSAVASIRVRPETGLLYLDFQYRGKRCREQTLLKDTKDNHRKLEQVKKRLEKQIADGSFEYSQFFPGSKAARRFEVDASTGAGLGNRPSNVLMQESKEMSESPATILDPSHPKFSDFADTWVSENEIAWRLSHSENQQSILDGHLKPAFGDKVVSHITKADILAFRASLAKVKGRTSKGLSPKRINAIMTPLRQILNEAADRFNFSTPYHNIKPLKVPKTHVEPFSLDEVQRILETVRPDYRNYYLVRFFTALRTGEIDGLKWEYVDFEQRLILVRETIVKGREEYTKNDGSQREIQMSEPVYDALREQERITRGRSKYVFCNRNGEPLDHVNVTKRVWYPLLRHLGLKPRRPYQTRHTAATLWLAAGESPEWIARQMGHSSTEMLFRVYSRYVPNLTRQDGSAFERLLRANQISFSDEPSVKVQEVRS